MFNEIFLLRLAHNNSYNLGMLIGEETRGIAFLVKAEAIGRALTSSIAEHTF